MVQMLSHQAIHQRREMPVEVEQVTKPKKVRGRKLVKFVPCDYCGVARAVFKVSLSTGELWFCRHHYNKHASAMKTVSTKITEYAE